MSDNPNDALARLKSVADAPAVPAPPAPAPAPPAAAPPAGPAPVRANAVLDTGATLQPPATPSTPATPASRSAKASPAKQPSKTLAVDKGKGKDPAEAGPSGPPPASVTTGVSLQHADEKTGKAGEYSVQTPAAVSVLMHAPAIQSLMNNDRAILESLANYMRAVESRDHRREQVHHSDMLDMRSQLAALAAEVVDNTPSPAAQAVNIGPLVDAHNEIVDSVTQTRSQVNTLDAALAVTQAETAANARAVEELTAAVRALNDNLTAFRDEMRITRIAPAAPSAPTAPPPHFAPVLPTTLEPEGHPPLKRLRTDSAGSSVPVATAAPAVQPAPAPLPTHRQLPSLPPPLGMGVAPPPPVDPTQPLPNTVVRIGQLNWGKDITGQVRSLAAMVPGMTPSLTANIVARRQGKFCVLVTFPNANDAAHFVALWNGSPPPDYRFLSVSLN
ncbi:hypothetical protein AURDEDRAFT_130448 [Auricularia subglabra TFB-10046 SS5]|nr:hypothetical protein AURDEDRAFT_130448 [Auricularia subglabra TFB-10046 SS5]